MRKSVPVIPPYVPEATMFDNSSSVFFHQYRITRHSIDRYAERMGGNLDAMLNSLQNAWLLHSDSPRMRLGVRRSVYVCEKAGGWCLCDGKAVFVIHPEQNRQVVVTTLSLRA